MKERFITYIVGGTLAYIECAAYEPDLVITFVSFPSDYICPYKYFNLFKKNAPSF